MSKLGVTKNKKLSPKDLLDHVIESYQKLLVCDITDLGNLLDKTIVSLSTIESNDPIVNKAKEQLNWNCQTWRDNLFCVQKQIESLEEYTNVWGGTIRATKQNTIENMKSHFYRKFKTEAELAFSACPSWPSFIISSSSMPATQSFVQPVTFSIKPSASNLLTDSDNQLWESIRKPTNNLWLSSSSSNGAEDPITKPSLF